MRPKIFKWWWVKGRILSSRLAWRIYDFTHKCEDLDLSLLIPLEDEED